MDTPYKHVHLRITQAIAACESEREMYTYGSLEPEWSKAQAAKYEVVLGILKSALHAGIALFGAE
jgi:hypothetical protein